MSEIYYSFIETSGFTKRLLKLLSDDEYSQFQITLSRNPYAGDLIPGGDGLRKTRWYAKGHGKRGGVRIIYYLVTAEGVILLLDIYAKNEKENISKDELKALIRLKHEELDEYE